MEDESGSRLHAVTGLVPVLRGSVLKLPDRAVDLLLTHVLNKGHPRDVVRGSIGEEPLGRDLAAGRRP